MKKFRKCRCGCGQRVKNRRNVFILGHNTRLDESPRGFKEGDIPWNIGQDLLPEPWNKGLTVKTSKKVKRAIEKGAKTRTGQKLSVPGWNKGLTKEMDKRVANFAKARKVTLSDPRNHPMYKKKHKKESRLKMRIARAKQVVPVKDTKIEVGMQKLLTRNGISFNKHKVVCYYHQADIVLKDYPIVIECDGEYWHKYPYGSKRDKYLTDKMRIKGYIVLRFWGDEILKHKKRCLKIIKKAIKDCDIVRSARIYKGAESDRNDLTVYQLKKIIVRNIEIMRLLAA